jgi:hypothetical protein
MREGGVMHKRVSLNLMRIALFSSLVGSVAGKVLPDTTTVPTVYNATTVTPVQQDETDITPLLVTLGVSGLAFLTCFAMLCKVLLDAMHRGRVGHG